MKKILVITDGKGRIIGTARAEHKDADGNTFALRPMPLEGQKVHEVALTPELEKLHDPVELHRAIETHLK